VAGDLALKAATLLAVLAISVWLGMRFQGTVRVAGREDGARGRANMHWNLIAFALIDGVRASLGYTVFRFHAGQLGAPEWVTPVYLGGMMAMYGLASYGWGAAADRFGNRRMLLLIALGGIIATGLVMPFLPLTLFLAASLLQFGLTGIIRIPLALVSEWTAEQQGEGIGVLHATGWLLSAAFGVIAGDLYVEHGLGGVTLISTVLYTLALAAAWRLTGPSVAALASSRYGTSGQPSVEAGVVDGDSSAFERLRRFLSFEDRWVPWIIAVLMLVAIARGGIVLTALNYVESTGIDLDIVFVIEAWAMLLNVLLFAVGGILCDRFGAERVLAASALLYMVVWCAFAIGLPPRLAVAAYVFPIAGLFYTAADALLARHTSEDERNRGLGVAGWAVFFGQFLGAMAATVIMYTLASEGVTLWLTTYRIMAPLLIAGGVMSVWLARRLSASQKSDAEPVL